MSDSIRDRVGGMADDAKNQGDQAAGEGGGLLDKLKQGVQGIKDGVQNAGADAGENAKNLGADAEERTGDQLDGGAHVTEVRTGNALN